MARRKRGGKTTLKYRKCISRNMKKGRGNVGRRMKAAAKKCKRYRKKK